MSGIFVFDDRLTLDIDYLLETESYINLKIKNHTITLSELEIQVINNFEDHITEHEIILKTNA